VDVLLGDPSKARRELNWQPRVTFRQLARMMTDADMKLAESEKVLKDHGKGL
jgi:GDPmannose 4,6-dehydratase